MHKGNVVYLCTWEHAYSWSSPLCRVTATLDLQMVNGLLSRTRYIWLTVCSFSWAFQNHAFQIMALCKKKMPFGAQPAPAVAGEPSGMTYLRLAAVDSKPLLVCLSHRGIQLILFSTGVALEMLCTCCLLPRTILSLNFEADGWLLSRKYSIGPNRTWHCAPRLCKLYGKPSVFFVYSQWGNGPIHILLSPLKWQALGFNQNYVKHHISGV